MSVRKLAATLAVMCAAALLVPVAAGAATPSSAATTNSFSHLPATGKGKNGKKFTGTFTVQKFVTAATSKGRKTEAIGTLTGHLGKKKITVTNVAAPVNIVKGSSSANGSTAQVHTDQVTIPSGCTVLNLTLGPLQLNLLGLVVTIPNPVVLNITAVPGAGNLLGNLLCGVTNLLNGSPTAGQTAAALNIVNAILTNLSGLLGGGLGSL